jgi:methylthioribose-1-phosphate isomerase
MPITPLEWLDNKTLRILDQTRLPHAEIFLDITDYRELARAIKELKVRGAPTIGVAAAYGVALGAQAIEADNIGVFRTALGVVLDTLAATRPTAKDLFYAIARMRKVAASGGDIEEIKEALIKEAGQIHSGQEAATLELAAYGATLISSGMTLLTHCNAGPLATTGYGTALGVIIRAHEQGKRIKVLATETRPLCQGSRLTTWELQRVGVPVTLITDSMVGYVMQRESVSAVIVGADRITANGDAANKIGTYTVAVMAREHGLPCYFAAPSSTFDLELKSGDAIPIEFRGEDEVTGIQGQRIAPVGVRALNPAFDVTPHKYISAIITEKGIIYPPFTREIKRVIG